MRGETSRCEKRIGQEYLLGAISALPYTLDRLYAVVRVKVFETRLTVARENEPEAWTFTTPESHSSSDKALPRTGKIEP